MMAGKKKQFNKQDKKIAERVENMNLETANELGVEGNKAGAEYRKNNKQKGNFYKQGVSEREGR